MNEITPASPPVTAPLSVVDQHRPWFTPFSNDLQQALACVREPFEEIESFEGMVKVERIWPHNTRKLLPEAKRALQEYTTALHFWATPEHVVAWLAPINSVVSNPRDAKGLFDFARALMIINPDIHLSVLNSDTRLLAARAWKHFPSAAEVLSLIEPIEREWMNTRFDLDRLVSKISRG